MWCVSGIKCQYLFACQYLFEDKISVRPKAWEERKEKIEWKKHLLTSPRKDRTQLPEAAYRQCKQPWILHLSSHLLCWRSEVLEQSHRLSLTLLWPEPHGLCQWIETIEQRLSRPLGTQSSWDLLLEVQIWWWACLFSCRKGHNYLVYHHWRPVQRFFESLSWFRPFRRVL